MSDIENELRKIDDFVKQRLRSIRTPSVPAPASEPEPEPEPEPVLRNTKVTQLKSTPPLIRPRAVPRNIQKNKETNIILSRGSSRKKKKKKTNKKKIKKKKKTKKKKGEKNVIV